MFLNEVMYDSRNSENTLSGPEHLFSPPRSPSSLDGDRAVSSLRFGPRLLRSLNKHGTQIKYVTYNSRRKSLIILDSRGCSSWTVAQNKHSLKREFNFPKYHFNVISRIVYCRKFNVYFGLGKDYTIRVYNKDFEEIPRAAVESCDLVTNLLFNPVTDELITGGDFVRCYRYEPIETDRFLQLASMSNYGLVLRLEFKLADGGWCYCLELDVARQRLYCFTDHSLLCYDMAGSLATKLKITQDSMVLASVFSLYTMMLLTAAMDHNISAWDESGHRLHVFRGHNQAVTSLLLHPNTPSIFISGSRDRTVRLWCLDTLTQLYSITCTEAVLGLGLTEEDLLYSWSPKHVQLYHLNHFLDFWGHLRYPAVAFSLCRAPGKTTRLLALGEDNSLHLFSCMDGRKLCMLPPHLFLSPLRKLPDYVYDRTSGLILLLLSAHEIWVYTARTDPPCRVAVLDVRNFLHAAHEKESAVERARPASAVCSTKGLGLECSSLGFLNSPVCYPSVEGPVCADCTSFMLCGMTDGRILFMDTAVRNLIHHELRTHKDPVVWLHHHADQNQLMNVCAQMTSRLVQIWSLPVLELLYQLSIPSDASVLTRMDELLFVGCQSGVVRVFRVLQTEKNETSEGESVHAGAGSHVVEEAESEHDHHGAVLSVDSCCHLNIFLSCGADSLVKLWDSQLHLLAEVVLDSTLSCACFLSPRGDLLLGFRMHLYKLSHLHLFSSSSLDTTSTSQTSLTESFIYEDPLLRYDSRKRWRDPEPLTVEDYIEPYRGLDFTGLFSLLVETEGKEEGMELQSSSDDEEVPHAPSRTYQSLASPVSSLSALSIRELILTPGHSSTDLSHVQEAEEPDVQEAPPPASNALEHDSTRPEPGISNQQRPAKWSEQLERVKTDPHPPQEEQGPEAEDRVDEPVLTSHFASIVRPRPTEDTVAAHASPALTVETEKQQPCVSPFGVSVSRLTTPTAPALNAKKSKQLLPRLADSRGQAKKRASAPAKVTQHLPRRPQTNLSSPRAKVTVGEKGKRRARKADSGSRSQPKRTERFPSRQKPRSFVNAGHANTDLSSGKRIVHGADQVPEKPITRRKPTVHMEETSKTCSRGGAGKREKRKLKDKQVREFVEETTDEEECDEWLQENLPENEVTGEERRNNVEEEDLEGEEEWKEKDEHPFGNKHKAPSDGRGQMGHFCLPRADHRQTGWKARPDGAFHAGGETPAGDQLSQSPSQISFTCTAAGREAPRDRMQTETDMAIEAGSIERSPRGQIMKERRAQSGSTWIEEELQRYEYLQAVRRERMRLAQQRREDLELNRIQHWVLQPRHVHCRSVQPPRSLVPLFNAEAFAITSAKLEEQSLGTGLPAKVLSVSSFRALPPAWFTDLEQPYRLQMAPLPQTPESTAALATEELWETDSKTGLTLLKRASTAPSIPSKGRYVLTLTGPKVVQCPASQLERWLLRKRRPFCYRALSAKAAILSPVSE